MLNGKLENSFISGQDKETLRRTRTERQNYEEISKEFRERIVKDLNTDELKSLSQKSGATLISVQAMMKVHGSYLRNIDNSLKKLVKVNDNFIKALTKNLSLGSRINLGNKASRLGSYAVDNRQNVLKNNKNYDNLDKSINSFTDVLKELDRKQNERTNEVLSMMAEVPTDISTNISMALDKTLRNHPILRRLYGSIVKPAVGAFNWGRQGIMEALGLSGNFSLRNFTRILSWNAPGRWEREVRINRSLPLQTIISLLSSIQKNTWLLNNDTLYRLEDARRGINRNRDTADRGGLNNMVNSMGPAWRYALSLFTQINLFTKFGPARWLASNVVSPIVTPIASLISGAARAIMPLLGESLINFPAATLGGMVAVPQLIIGTYRISQYLLRRRINAEKRRQRNIERARGNYFNPDYDANLITTGFGRGTRRLINERDRSQTGFGYFREELNSSIRQRGIRQYISNVFRSVFDQDRLRQERESAARESELRAAEDFRIEFIRRIANRTNDVVDGIIGLREMEHDVTLLRERIAGRSYYNDIRNYEVQQRVNAANDIANTDEARRRSPIIDLTTLYNPHDATTRLNAYNANNQNVQNINDQRNLRNQNRRNAGGFNSNVDWDALLNNQQRTGLLTDIVRDGIVNVINTLQHAGLISDIIRDGIRDIEPIVGDIRNIHTGLHDYVYGRGVQNTILDNTRQIREDINWFRLTFENFLGQNNNTIEHYVNQINDTIRALYDQNTQNPLTAILNELNHPTNGIHAAITGLNVRLNDIQSSVHGIHGDTNDIRIHSGPNNGVGINTIASAILQEMPDIINNADFNSHVVSIDNILHNLQDVVLPQVIIPWANTHTRYLDIIVNRQGTIIDELSSTLARNRTVKDILNSIDTTLNTMSTNRDIRIDGLSNAIINALQDRGLIETYRDAFVDTADRLRDDLFGDGTLFDNRYQNIIRRLEFLTHIGDPTNKAATDTIFARLDTIITTLGSRNSNISNNLRNHLMPSNESLKNAADFFTNTISQDKDSLFYKMAKNISGIYKILASHFGQPISEDYDATHYFAEGGIVTGPINAVVGENGTEAILPLEGPKAKSWIGNLVEEYNNYKISHIQDGVEGQLFTSSFIQDKLSILLKDVLVKPLGEETGTVLGKFGSKMVMYATQTALGKTKVGAKLYGFVDKIEGLVDKGKKKLNNMWAFFKDPLKVLLGSANKPAELGLIGSIINKTIFPVIGIGLFLLLSSSRFKSAIGKFFKELIPNIIGKDFLTGFNDNFQNLADLMPSLEDKLKSPFADNMSSLLRLYTPAAIGMDVLELKKHFGNLGTSLGEGNISDTIANGFEGLNALGRSSFAIVINKLTGLPYGIASAIYNKASTVVGDMTSSNVENVKEQEEMGFFRKIGNSYGLPFQALTAWFHGDKEGAEKAMAAAQSHFDDTGWSNAFTFAPWLGRQIGKRIGGAIYDVTGWGEDPNKTLAQQYADIEEKYRPEKEKQMSNYELLKNRISKYGLKLDNLSPNNQDDLKKMAEMRTIIDTLENKETREGLTGFEVEKMRYRLAELAGVSEHRLSLGGISSHESDNYKKAFSDKFLESDDFKRLKMSSEDFKKGRLTESTGWFTDRVISRAQLAKSPELEYFELRDWLRQNYGEGHVLALDKAPDERKKSYLLAWYNWRYADIPLDKYTEEPGHALAKEIFNDYQIQRKEFEKKYLTNAQNNIKEAVKEISKEIQVPNETNLKIKEATKDIPNTNGSDTASTIGQTVMGGLSTAYNATKNFASTGYEYLANAITPAKTTAAEALARNAYKIASSMGGTKSTGYCARGVKNAMMKAGIIKKYPSGNAWQMSSLLSGNNNFQEITNQFATKQALTKAPRGSIIVWNKKDGASKYGHIAVSLGNGKEASDHVRNTIVDNSNRYGGFRVFYPVSKDGVTYNSGGLNINELANSAWESTKSGLNTAKNFATTKWSDFKNSDTYKNNIAPLTEKADSLMQTASEKIGQGFSNISVDKAKELGAYYVDLVKNSDYNASLPKIKEEFIAKAKEYGLTTEAIEEYYNKLKEAGQPVFSNIMQKGKELYENTSSYITEQAGHVAENTLGVVGNIKAILMSGVSDKLDKLVKLFEELKVRLEQASKGTPIAISNVNNNSAVTNNTSNSSTVMNNNETELSKEGARLLDAISE